MKKYYKNRRRICENNASSPNTRNSILLQQCLLTMLYHHSVSGNNIGVNLGFGGRDPEGDVGGSQEGRGRVSENTIGYFAQKVFWKVVSSRKREKLSKIVGVNGRN